jgi:hypothetical protein
MVIQFCKFIIEILNCCDVGCVLLVFVNQLLQFCVLQKFLEGEFVLPKIVGEDFDV